MLYWLVPVIYRLFDLLNLIIIVRVILSWIPHDRYNPIIKIVYDITDPLFAPFQGKVNMGGLDLSPIVVLFIVGIVRSLVLNLLIAF
ncbi:MAG: YggT family protein [Candidatus Margulisbacteria bacterium]|nr:YggT family protein [Candidatus Margulisiibacteriota bacterium]